MTSQNTQKNFDLKSPLNYPFVKEKHEKNQAISNLDQIDLESPSVSKKQKNFIQIMQMESGSSRLDLPSIQQQFSEESMVSESLPGYESDFQQQVVVDEKIHQKPRSKASNLPFKQDLECINSLEAPICQQKQELFQDQMENEADDQQLFSDSDSSENYSESLTTNIIEEEQYYSSQMSDQNSSSYSSSNYRR